MTKYRQIIETGLIVAAISDLELSTETVSYYVNFRIAVLGIFLGKKKKLSKFNHSTMHHLHK